MARPHRETEKKLRIIRFGIIILAVIIIGFAAIMLLNGGEVEIPVINGING